MGLSAEHDSSLDALLAFDREHLWHPYSSMARPNPMYVVDSASGVRLRMRTPEGTREVIDAMSSWWCAVHGYAVPELDAALREQASSMSHVMFGGLTHEPAVGLARRLVELVGLPRVFLADSGSVSVEVAMKMAWQAQAHRGRTRFLTVRGGYHGDTFSPMSVCDPEGGMHAMYGGLVPQHVFAPVPPRDLDDPSYAEWAAEVTGLFDEHGDALAGVIVEPLLQGAGGMRPWPPAAVDLISDLARSHGALVIHDEIATGLWRLGTAMAQDQLRVRADIVCVGKALTGGYLTLAATLCTDEVAAAVDASPAGGMMHGPTFMGNPLACAVANASLDLLSSNDTPGRIARIEERLDDVLAPARDLPGVLDVRTVGAVGVIQLDRPVHVPRATVAALDAGVWVRPFRDLIYTMPPYITNDDDLATIGAGLVAAAEEALA